MSNVLNEEKKQQAVALGRLGWSLRRIQKAIGVRRETISVYLKAAGIAMRSPRGQIIPAKPASREDGVITDPTCAKPASPSEVITDSGGESATLVAAKPVPLPGRSPSSSACIPHRDVIELGLSRGRNAMAIWQELVDTCGFAGGYQSVRRFVSRLHGSQHLKACAVIETPPGEEAQVDYGEGPMVRDPQNGKYRRTRLFVLTLGYSRKSVRLLVFRSSSQTWAELHETTFRRLGCCITATCSGAARAVGEPRPRQLHEEKGSLHSEGAALALPGFTALSPEWRALSLKLLQSYDLPLASEGSRHFHQR